MTQKRSKEHKKTPVDLRAFFYGCIFELDVDNSANTLLHNHEDEVENPQYPSTQENTDDTCNNLTFGESGDHAKNPSGKRDDCQDYTYYVRKTEVI